MVNFNDMKYKFLATQQVEDHEMYKHILENKTLYIMDAHTNVIATLEQDDIIEMLRVLNVNRAHPEMFKGLF